MSTIDLPAVRLTCPGILFLDFQDYVCLSYSNSIYKLEVTCLQKDVRDLAVSDIFFCFFI